MDSVFLKVSGLTGIRSSRTHLTTSWVQFKVGLGYLKLSFEKKKSSILHQDKKQDALRLWNYWDPTHHNCRDTEMQTNWKDFLCRGLTQDFLRNFPSVHLSVLLHFEADACTVKQAQPLLRLEADIIPVHTMLVLQAYKMKQLQNHRCQPTQWPPRLCEDDRMLCMPKVWLVGITRGLQVFDNVDLPEHCLRVLASTCIYLQ